MSPGRRRFHGRVRRRCSEYRRHWHCTISAVVAEEVVVVGGVGLIGAAAAAAAPAAPAAAAQQQLP